MKNSKLLLTSALVGTVAMGVAAHAETTIKGGATYTYASKNGTAKAGNTQGAGKEVQIDISKSGELDNGMGFSAGFSLEQDGSQSSFDGSEGNFMRVTSGSTSVTYNIDKAPNLSSSVVPRASTSVNTMAAGMTATAFDYSPGSQAQQSAWNLAVETKFDGGNLAFVYVPRMGDAGGNNDNFDTSQKGTSMDVIFQGNLGVDGLKARVAMSDAEAASTTLQDNKVMQLGVAYNFGSFAVGYQQADIDQKDSTEDKQKEYGVTYSVSDKLTVGVLQTQTDNNSAKDEEITAAQIGYNLGPVTVEAYGISVKDPGGSETAADEEKFGLRFGTKF
jgi:hypothetical protein